MVNSAGPFVAMALLVGVLGFAVARPRGLPEAVAAVAAAGVVVALGVVTPAAAWAEVTTLLPVVALLATVLSLPRPCDAEGLFAAAGALIARYSGGSRAGRAALGGVESVLGPAPSSKSHDLKVNRVGVADV